MDDPFELSGKIVIVTGGGRGVGRGISERFLEAGAEVVICGRKEPDKPLNCPPPSPPTPLVKRQAKLRGWCCSRCKLLRK